MKSVEGAPGCQIYKLRNMTSAPFSPVKIHHDA